MVDCKDGDLSAVFCNTTFCQHCSSSCSFFHGNDPRIILLPWQPLVNLVWPSPVIQCLSIHLHSLHLCLSCCKLPVFIYIYFLHHSPHSVIHFFFFSISTCVGVSWLLLHKQSIHLHKLMSYFRGQSVHMHALESCRHAFFSDSVV